MATKAKKTGGIVEELRWPFGTKNYVMFGVSLAVIVLGYILLGRGDITLAPILLVLGYCVLIPVAIMLKGRPETDATEEPAPETSDS